MRNVKPLVLACTALWGAMICNVASAEVDPSLSLGYSNDQDQQLTSICLNPGSLSTSGYNMGYYGAQLSSSDELKQQLNVKNTLHSEYDAFNSNLNDELLSRISTDDMSYTIVYKADMQFKDNNYSVTDQSNPLSPWGKQALSYGADNFRNYCGDAYTTTLHNGAYVYIIYQLNFLSTADKQKFVTYLGNDFNSLAPFTQVMQDTINQQNIKGWINILGYQIGGIPADFPTVFNTPDPSKPIPSNCDLSNLLACSPLVSNIADYLSTNSENPEGFVKQIGSYTPDGPIPVNAGTVGMEYTEYSSLNPAYNSKSQLTPDVIAMRDKLSTMLETTQAYSQRAQYLKIALPWTYNYQVFRQNLDTQINNLQDNTFLLYDAGANCFNNLSTCISNTASDFMRMKPIKKSAIAAPETLDVITTVSGQPTTEQLFVAVDTTNPQDQTFQGNQITATPVPYPGAMPSNATINISNSDIYITQTDPNTGAITAGYIGGLDTTNHYSGTVNFTDGRQGTWTAVLTPADTGTQ